MSPEPRSNDSGAVDVLEISDCRFPGQISRSLAAELAVQYEGGLRTAVHHVNGPLVARALPFHPELAVHFRVGRVRLLLGNNPIESRVTLVRHPALLQAATVRIPPILTERLVIVCGANPMREDGTEIYDPASVESAALRIFGRRPVWAPTTPVVRDELLQRLPDAEITEDWFHPIRYEPLDPERHLARLTALMGEPVATIRPTTTHASRSTDRPRVLFLTSNGAGMGHLTRLMAYARRLQGDLDPYFLSLSQAVGVVRSYGMPYEYLPSSGASGLAPREWNALFATRVRETIERVRPRVVVFDATYPYAGISKIRQADPTPVWIWSRRGMWKAEHDGERAQAQVDKARWFDAVLEPGDFAADYDRGATARQPSERVGPVTLLDHRELAEREAARRALGLPADGPLALLSLGAGNINDTSGDVGAATEALRKLGVGICLTQSQIGVAGRVANDVYSVSYFPLSKYSRAFDIAVSAAGYNSFHELLRFGVPTLFVPNTQTSLDDQLARSRFAADHGLAHTVDAVRIHEAVDLLADLLANGHQMVARLRERDPGNGASDGAELISRLATRNEVPV